MATHRHSPLPGDNSLGDNETTAPATISDSPPRRQRSANAPFTVLCFDGGGYRGYTSLLILRDMLRRLRPEGPVYPYLYFDLICGTSTEGLIAILLSVLHLDIDTAIREYVSLSRALFKPRFRAPQYLLHDEEYINSELLRKAMSHILDSYGCGRKFMEDPEADRGCKCFVTVAHCNKEKSTVSLVRSYPPPGGAESTPVGYKWTIMDAAAATAAVPSFFKSHVITTGGKSFTFEDAGAHGVNNPTTMAWEEVKRLTDGGENKACFISIGTSYGGKSATEGQTPNSGQHITAVGRLGGTITNLFDMRLRGKQLARGLSSRATDVKEIELLMESYTNGKEASYYRFNPDQLEDIALSGHKVTSRLTRAVYPYLQENQRRLKECSYQIDSALTPTLATPATYTKHAKKWWHLGALNQCWG